MIEPRSFERVLVLSDIHGKCGMRLAIEIIERERFDALVLLGDVVDVHYMDLGDWCRIPFKEASKIISKAKNRKVYYILGNHDELFPSCPLRPNVEMVSELLIKVKGRRYFLIHGHQGLGYAIERAKEYGATLVVGHFHKLGSEGGVVFAGTLCDKVILEGQPDPKENLGYVVLEDSPMIIPTRKTRRRIFL